MQLSYERTAMDVIIVKDEEGRVVGAISGKAAGQIVSDALQAQNRRVHREHVMRPKRRLEVA